MQCIWLVGQKGNFAMDWSKAVCSPRLQIYYLICKNWGEEIRMLRWMDVEFCILRDWWLKRNKIDLKCITTNYPVLELVILPNVKRAQKSLFYTGVACQHLNQILESLWSRDRCVNDVVYWDSASDLQHSENSAASGEFVIWTDGGKNSLVCPRAQRIQELWTTWW